MALNAYLRLKGQKQGEIRGSVIQKGRENSIAVHAYYHELGTPQNTGTGLATGKRQHSVFTLIKELDKSTPLLFNALTSNENLTQWELRCFTNTPVKAAGSGTEQNHFTIVLKNARVVSIRSIMENNLEEDSAGLPQMEELSFVYDEISWTWTEGGITASDAWKG